MQNGIIYSSTLIQRSKDYDTKYLGQGIPYAIKYCDTKYVGQGIPSVTKDYDTK